jgi:CubicO group peptidase (beta-lactamase class C family)
MVYARGFGYADVENKLPVTIHTQFRTASVAKVITTTALGKLAGENKIDLDAPIQKYLPGFPEKNSIITPRQLAGHVAGFPHYSSNDRIEDRPYKSISDALSVFSHVNLVASPGTEYHYSTHGYTLLSGVIEAAAQKTFLKYLNQEIFQPLGMKSTGPDDINEPGKNIASLYTLKKGILAKIERAENTSSKWGAGGLISTPTDLVRLTNAYFNGLLKPEIVKMMFSSQQLNSGEKTQVGIGWRLSWDGDGRRVLEHAGSMGGARTVVCIFPEEQVAIAIMINAEWSSMIEETAHLLALPYLSERVSSSRSEGNFPVDAIFTNLRGEKEAQKGQLSLTNGFGKLTFNPNTGLKEILPLICLERGNVYALFRPDGAFRLTLNVKEGLVNGSVIGYGSPLQASPANHPPFLSFKEKP